MTQGDVAPDNRPFPGVGLSLTISGMTGVVKKLSTAAALGGAALGGAALAAEALYAGRRDLPTFEGFDASAEIGDPAKPPLRILVVGDSATTGPGLSDPDEIWIRVLAARLSDRFFVRITSLAVGGARSADVLTGQVPAAIDRDADMTFVAVGVNDMLRGVPLAVYETNLDAIVVALKPFTRLLVVVGMGDLGTIPRLLTPLDLIVRRRGRQGDMVAARVAERRGVVKPNMWALTTQQFRTNPAIWAPDLFHPSAVGHRVWADAAWVTIEPYLDSLS